jgi:predicted aspartyl protease
MEVGLMPLATGYSRRNTILGALAAFLPFQRLMAQDAAPIVSKVTLAQGRLWVGVEIEGQGPFPFMIDTGAHLSLIEDATARRLKLDAVGRTRVNGAGGTETLPVYATGNLVIGGGIREKDAVFAAMTRRVSPEAIGTLSAGIMTQVDSDMDFAAGEWRLYPQGRGERTGFAAVPSSITHVGSPEGSAYIFAKGVLNGQWFDFLLDTGAPLSLYLGSSATKRSGLWDDNRPYAPMRRSGIGGTAGRLSRLVRADRFQVGDMLFEHPLVNVNDPDLNDDKKLREGIIGLPFLQRMTLSTDVKAGKLWVQGNGLPAVPERYGLSGLWLDEKRGATVVADVGTGSPAAKAGVQVGDVLANVPLAQAIRMIGQRPGTQIALTFARAGAAMEKRFVLTPYL